MSGRTALAERARKRLVLPLDVPTAAQARELVDLLHEEVGLFKVGKELFCAAGPDFVRSLTAEGLDVFLDLKFHDIPRTVAQASVQAARLGVRILNVHASGSLEMMETTAKEVRRVCRREKLTRPSILGVTVLTSLSGEDLRRIGVRASPRAQVLRLASLARDAGLDGVVASPLEIEAVREACGDRFTILTPGVRPRDADIEDQKRVATPAAAIAAGADYVVIGSPIRNAPDPVAAARAIVEEMTEGMKRRRTRR